MGVLQVMKSDRQVSCLVCEKILDIKQGSVMDGGRCNVSFGYGSQHDQIGAIYGLSDIDNLLLCNRIIAYICDECFDKKSTLFEGYKITKKTTLSRII